MDVGLARAKTVLVRQNGSKICQVLFAKIQNRMSIVRDELKLDTHEYQKLPVYSGVVSMDVGLA
jgi:hypothetical protein